MTDRETQDLPTRGEGMPADRGGNVVPLGKSKKKETKAAAAQEAARERAEKEWLLGKVTRKELEESLTKLVGGLVAIRNQNHSIGLRLESTLLALRRWMPAEEKEKFNELLNDSHQRMSKWLGLVQMFESGDLPLKRIYEEVEKWNGDSENPRFQFSGFSPGTIETKVANDLDMNREEKEAFLDLLGTPQQIKDSIFEAIKKRLTPQGLDNGQDLG